MLRTMLNSHPELAIPHETRFFVDAYRRRDRFGDLSVTKNRRRVARWILNRRKSRVSRLTDDPDELAARIVAAPPALGSLLSAGFVLYAEHRGKSRWGDKRPSYAVHLDAVFAMHPDAQFVHIVRDPRAAVASMRKVGLFADGLVGGTDMWVRSMRSVDRWRRKLRPDQLLEIQYEHLVADPQPVLEQLADFCGLDRGGVDAMLAFYEHSDIGASGLFHPLVSTPVTTDAVRSWEESLDPDEVAFIERTVSSQMNRYGYEPVAGGVPVPSAVRRRYRSLRFRRARQRVSLRTREMRLRFTYRQPVAAVRR